MFLKFAGGGSGMPFKSGVEGRFGIESYLIQYF
jgi:hypothetical protein